MGLGELAWLCLPVPPLDSTRGHCDTLHQVFHNQDHLYKLVMTLQLFKNQTFQVVVHLAIEVVFN